jgi:hypothetical protein
MKDTVSKTLVILGMPFAILFMAGEIIAAPLEKYRHSNVFVWLLWKLLRMSVPIAIIFFSAFCLFRKLRGN